MAFSEKICISVNRDIILPSDFTFDPIKGFNTAKKKVMDDEGKLSDPGRSDYKMTDLQFNEYTK